MKPEVLLKCMLHKYFDLVEENIKEGHYVETDFRHYSELVRALVDKTQIMENAIFFTGLCIPPFQWYNYNLDNPNAQSVSEVCIMEADSVWTDYLRFVKTLADADVSIYRCVFSAENGFGLRTYFRDLVEDRIVEAQFAAYIISDKKDYLRPLSGEEIRRVLGDKINNDYRCYKSVSSAYLIVDQKDLPSISYDHKVYEAKSVRDHFAIFQPDGFYKKWIYKQSYPCRKALPEDFFLFGTGRKLNEVEWHFILAADVARDLMKVTLWFMTPELPANRKEANGEYHERFDFVSIKNFVNNIVIQNIC